MAEPKRILGFLKDFRRGINSDIPPLSLAPNQLAYATNISLRGDYPLPRPNFFNLTLIDTTGGTTLASFQAALFQGCKYYRGQVDGSIVVAVAGQFYQIAIASNVGTVTKIPLPALDPGDNPTTPQIWMEQAEQFLVINDGQNLPFFYDTTTAFANGLPMRRSFGTSQTPVGKVLTQFTVPPIGQTVLVQVQSVTPSDAGLAYLLGESQFVIDSVTPSTTDPSTNLGTNVLKSAAGDQLLCQADGSSFDGATLYTNNSYLSTIATGAAVVQTTGVGTVTDWGQIVAPGPAPTVTIKLSPATGMSINQFEMAPCRYSSIAQTCTFLWFKPPILIDVGSTINVDGVNCKITGMTTYASASYLGTGGHPNAIPAGYLIDSITVQPVSAAQTGLLTAVTVTTNDVYSIHINVAGSCATRNSKSGVINQPQSIIASNGATTWQNAAPAAAAGYFTVRLNFDPSGVLNTTTQYTFQVFAGNGQPLTFTGYYGGLGTYQLINCQMAAPPAVGAGYTVQQVAGVATNSNQYVQVTKSGTNAFNAVLTTVATVYNATTTSGGTTYSNVNVGAIGTALVIPVKLAQTIVAGNLLFSIAINTNTDIFVATATSQVAGGTDTYAALVNQSGVEGSTIPAATPIIPLPELPPGKMLVYGQGRIWEALPDGISFVAGDIVGGASGTNTAPENYNYTDAVLKVSQNLFLAGGTTFKIPGSGVEIMAMQFVAVLDVSLGQGDLQVFTQNTVFGCDTPSDATTWASLTYPILTESLIGAGGVSQSAVNQVNGDILFRTSDGAVQSMTLARLDFYKWGLTPISKEITRIIQFDNPLLLQFCSAVVFNNRYMVTSQPHQCARGVYHTAIAALNFDAVSTLGSKQPSIWEGAYTGLNVLSFVTDSDGNAGTYGGQKRCFALCLDPTLATIQLVEILPDTSATMDNLTQPVIWSFESPTVFNQEKDAIKREYKRLLDGEIYIDSLTPDGVTIAAYYKPDQNTVWTPWWTTTVNYQSNDSGFRPRVGFGQPPGNVYDTANNRPMREGYDFQVMLVFTGYCRFLEGRFMAEIIPQPEFSVPKKQI